MNHFNNNSSRMRCCSLLRRRVPFVVIILTTVVVIILKRVNASSTTEWKVQMHFDHVFSSSSNTKTSYYRRNNRSSFRPVRYFQNRRKRQRQRQERDLGNNNDDDNVVDDDANNNNGDDYYSANDDDAYENNNNNNNNADDDGNKGGSNIDDLISEDNEMCSQFLFSFLEGTTDARDTCEGIMNAYTAAECSSKDYNIENFDYDDYFNEFTEHQCCQALQSHHADYCEEDNLLSNFHLFVAAAVLLLCECTKAAVAKIGWHFIPEAAVCILVGTTVGLLSRIIPGTSIDDLSFDDELFLSLLLPPIIFEAALSVSKFEFKRRRGAIFMFSVFGTVISTFSTGFMVHYASKVSNATTFPMLDSLVFGALISSIDPVAILSVLTSLHMDQKDTIFILVFGESLLNDGIAITVFQTLRDRFDGKTNDGTFSLDEVLDALATFLLAMFGSIGVGLACGCGAWVYFNFLTTLLPPVMEVGSFFLWALIPYYICDGIGWSGIVGIVAVGFFMDIYIAGPKVEIHRTRSVSPAIMSQQQDDGYQDFDDCDSSTAAREYSQDESLPTARSINPLPSTERVNLSNIADKHVRFVAHLTSQLAENAIFAYLGLFLFSNNYDWNPTLVTISIVSCILSRAIMVVVVAYLLFQIYKCRGAHVGLNSSRTAAAIQDKRTQAVLVLAGLRGAVSLALVENVPIYNNVTGEGCEFKQVMKGMTSACILFTTFVFGGSAYYILPHLGIQNNNNNNCHNMHMMHNGTPHPNHSASSSSPTFVVKSSTSQET